VLPIACGPHRGAAPYEPPPWLRRPSHDPGGQLLSPPPVPRVATPPEPLCFCYATTEGDPGEIRRANR
jgi:hypothetical protein